MIFESAGIWREAEGCAQSVVGTGDVGDVGMQRWSRSGRAFGDVYDERIEENECRNEAGQEQVQPCPRHGRGTELNSKGERDVTRRNVNSRVGIGSRL